MSSISVRLLPSGFGRTKLFNPRSSPAAGVALLCSEYLDSSLVPNISSDIYYQQLAVFFAGSLRIPLVQRRVCFHMDGCYAVVAFSKEAAHSGITSPLMVVVSIGSSCFVIAMTRHAM